jgi:hypothetical protein
VVVYISVWLDFALFNGAVSLVSYGLVGSLCKGEQTKRLAVALRTLPPKVTVWTIDVVLRFLTYNV